MSDQAPPPTYTPAPAAPAKKRSCWLYGCISLAALTLIGLVATIFIVRAVFHKLVDQYASDSPLAIEKVTLPDAQMTNLLERVAQFSDALEKQDQPRELILTADEINALIGQNDELAGKVLVQIDGDKIKGQISLPLTPLGLEGRYLNGEATFNVAITDNQLGVRIDQATVNGQAIPEVFTKELQKQDWAREIKDPEFQRAIAKFDSIEVTEGRIICRNRVTAGKADAPSPAAETP